MRRKQFFAPKLWLPAIASLLLFTEGGAPAQVTTAAIHGTVTDTSGAVISSAKVMALDTATGISTVTTTNQSGYYVFPALQIGGPYTITVSSPGFQQFVSNGSVLSVNANLEVNVKLAIGGTQQTVTVNAGAVQVETANTQLEQEITASQIGELPLFGRDAASLERLAPGVMESSDRFGSYSVNGSQTTDNSFQIEGIDNNDGPLQDEGLTINPDALQQENTIESTINPEFSRNGGAVVNQAVKSGTNQFHGSGFEYYRDTFMNLGGYFALPGVRPPFHQNLYGGTLGGPIVRNRLFLFMAYQGLRNRTGVIQQTTVFQNGILSSGIFTNEKNPATGGPDGGAINPATKQLVGGLSSNPIPFDITTGTGTCGPGTANLTWSACFPVTAPGTPIVINPTSFNSLAATLANKYVPAGNAGSATAPLYNFPTSNTGAQDQGVMRADYHIGNNDAIYGVGIFDSSPSYNSLSFGGSNLPGFPQDASEHFKLFSAQETHTFSANTLNVLRAGYFRFNFSAVNPAKIVAPSSVGFNINPQASAQSLPLMTLTGLFKLGFTYEGPQPRKDTNLTYSDNFSHVMGNHELKVGATLEQFRVNNPYYADNNGSYGYGGNGEYSSGDPGIDFLLGIPDTYAQSSGGFIDAVAYEYYAFAQDSWRMTPDMTVNYGIAWDVEQPNQNQQFNGKGMTCFAVNNTTSTVFTGGFPGLTFPGDPGCNVAGGATTHWNHFGPRVGLAWSPSSGPSALIGEPGQHKFSIRAGFGLYYNRDQEEGQLQNLGDIPNYLPSNGAANALCPNGNPCSPGFANPFADVATGTSVPNPFPYVRPKPGAALNWGNYVEQDMNAIDKNYDVPYIYNFNLNIQRQLPSNVILQIGYVGSLGHRLATVYESDPITPAGHAACLANSSCVANSAFQHLFYPQNAAQPATTGGLPDFLSVGTLATSGASNYNSLQVSLVKNTTHGLYFTFAYTYAHGLDNASGLESAGFMGRMMNQYPGEASLNYGNSDYDARQRIAASYDYRVPLLASMRANGVVDEILGDWHVAGFTILQSGFPVLVTDFSTFNSLWCDAFSYYSCPDTPNTTSFKIKKFNPRTINASSLLNQGFDSTPFYQEGTTPSSGTTVVNPGVFGNVGRNFFHGPGFNYTDLSLYKNLALGHERTRAIQLMMQAQNVFNHANFAEPDGNFTDGPNFGTISSVKSSADYNGDPAPGRTVQLAGRITF